MKESGLKQSALVKQHKLQQMMNQTGIKMLKAALQKLKDEYSLRGVRGLRQNYLASLRETIQEQLLAHQESEHPNQ